ncbi:hypothetical protein [Flavobacterium sp. 3HN19-14]|uniref:hypothetical protein n=1 Tax=Flavobacterium sp. 3HN19-14 TaxID=3448133 RepID=UPI003EE0D411
MQKHFTRYSDLYVIIIAGLLGIAVFYYLDRKLELLIAIFGGGISIAFSLRQDRIENDKMFKELFIMYNEKYDQKFNNCLNEIENEIFENPNYKLSDKQVSIVIDYLNLCAEEYLWFTKGRIDKSAWNSWERGIKHYLNISAIKKVVQNEKKQKDSYYGIFEYLNL